MDSQTNNSLEIRGINEFLLSSNNCQTFCRKKGKSVLMTLIQNEESLLVYVKEGYEFCAI